MLIGKAPNGLRIVGTDETCSITYYVEGFTRDADGSVIPEYNGESDVSYDGAEYDGKVIDENGQTWLASECTFTEETEEK